MTEVRQPNDVGRQMDELFRKFTEVAGSRLELPTENGSKAIEPEGAESRPEIHTETGSDASPRIDTGIHHNGREPPADVTAHNVHQNVVDRVLQELGTTRQALTDVTKEIEETKANVADIDRAYFHQHAELDEFRRDRSVVDRVLQELEATQQTLTDVTKEVEETKANVADIDQAYFHQHAELEELRRELVDAQTSSAVSSNQALGATGVIFLIGRIAIVITFIMSALFWLVDPDAIATIIASKLSLLPSPLADLTASIEARFGVSFATVVVIAGASLEIAAAVSIAMGVFIRPASTVLLIFTAIGIYGSSQWDFQNGVRADQIIDALNELSITGGLLILFSGVRPRAIGG